MWKALKEVHMQQKPTARFNAYEALFNITKSNDESLPAVAARVEKAMHTIKDLRPSEFTLNELDDDLACMALIRSLPPDQYASFRSSLLLLPSISMSVLKDALQAEESNRQPSAAAAAAVVATSKKQRPKCTFCDKLGHSIDKCYAYRDASRDAKDKAKQPKSASDSANVAQAASNACTFNTGPSLSDASSDWNTDTGATSHMTPHRHWFYTYTPHRIPIKLANNLIIHSEGKGSVRFQPVIDGRPGQMLEFQNVLHVPDLRNNLLSVLYLTQNKNYIVTIEKDKLYFRQNGSLLFTASVNAHNSAYLDGHAVPFQYAALASTCQLDRTLWHRRFAHLNHASIKELIGKELVQGMIITSQTPPDPICEPCICEGQWGQPDTSAVSTKSIK